MFQDNDITLINLKCRRFLKSGEHTARILCVKGWLTLNFFDTILKETREKDPSKKIVFSLHPKIHIVRLGYSLRPQNVINLNILDMLPHGGDRNRIIP